jgi:hypothetical protein
MAAKSSVDSRKPSSPLKCFIQIRDLHACATHYALNNLNTLKPDGMEINFIDPDLSLAHKVLERYPLDYENLAEDDPRQAHLILIGFPREAEKMLLAAAHTAHFANGLLPRVGIFNARPEARQQFEARYPYADKAAEIHFAPFPLESREGGKILLEWAGDERFLTTLAFFSEPASLAIQQVLGLPPELKGERLQKLLYLGAQHWQKPLLQFLESLHLHPFGIDIGALDMEALTYARLAEALHETYRAKNPQVTGPAALPWKSLPMEYKQSNFSQAAHFLVKVRAIACELQDPQDPSAPGTLEFELKEHEVECLARMEHARWVAERSLGGWRFCPDRDNTLLYHPNLVAYDELDEPTKEKDRDFVRELPEHAKLLNKTLVRIKRAAEE